MREAVGSERNGPRNGSFEFETGDVPRCVASQTLETHKKQLRAARQSRDLQRRGCGWDHVKML